MMKAGIITTILLMLVLPVSAKTGNNKVNIDNKDSQLLFNNLTTTIYSKYIDKGKGLSLESLTEKLFLNNRNLQINNLDLNAAQGRLLQSGLLLNPAFEIETGTNTLIDRGSDYDLNLTYSQPIELFGKTGKRYKVAELQLEALKNDIQFRNQQYISSISNQYINTLVEAESLKLAEQLFNLNKKLLKLTEDKYINGDTSKFDVNLIRIEVGRLNSRQILAENRVKTSLFKLKTLLGIDINQDLKLSGNLFSTDLLPDTIKLQQFQDAALKIRYDLKAVNINQDVAQERINQLEAEASPNINIIGKYIRQKSTFENTPVGPITNTDNTISAGLSFELPISNRNQGNIAEAEAIFNQSKFRKELLELEVKRDITLAYSNLQSAKQSLLLYQNQILKDSRENLWITHGTNELGEQDLLYVIIEQTRLAEVQKEYIEALKQYNSSVIELETALGAPLQTILSELKGERK